MLFNTLEFLVFFPIVFLLYWLVLGKSLKLQNYLILISSYFFYGWWSWKFMVLLAISTLLDYLYGFGVASQNSKKAKIFLWLSIINNLGILAVFKYYNFFALQFQTAFEAFGFHVQPYFLDIVLPIGISFYTFHGMSYVFDIYRKQQAPIKNFVDYAVFVSFFPLLVAGPIERANHLLPQVQKPRTFKYSQALEGCRLVLWGMFKKIVIADSLAMVVDPIFVNYHDQSAVLLIIGAIAFSFQIYTDFSGYSDIALGTAKILGFELLSNFKFPYFSRDVAEFWRRWHISLSSWFRDYLYIPLGGSKGSKWTTVRNTFIIFLVSGFWHGASWNFIVWGGIHACGFLPLLLINKNRKHIHNVVANNNILPNLKELFQMISTFVFVTLAWIFFRLKDVNDGFMYLKRIFVDLFEHPSQLFHNPGGKMALIFIVPLVLIDWYLRHDERDIKVPRNSFIRFSVYVLMAFLCLIGLFKGSTESSFIYFQF
jgi:alginate O-acetyltransferase complex protein AlgI